MDSLKWVGLAIVALLVFVWLRNQGGMSGSGSFNAQLQPAGWGSGMVYAPGMAYTQSYPYGYPWGYGAPSPQAYAFGGQAPIYANYSPDNGVTFQYGW